MGLVGPDLWHVPSLNSENGPALKSVINTWPQPAQAHFPAIYFVHLIINFTAPELVGSAPCALCILASYQALDCNSIYCCIRHAKQFLARSRKGTWKRPKQDRPGNMKTPAIPAGINVLLDGASGGSECQLTFSRDLSAGN